MKTTSWLCPVLTLLCITKLVYTAQKGSYGGYPLENIDSKILQNDYYFLPKRNKPSLSIVNPLDVLRQRLLLEIARRQMKENTRQVELNRAILNNVGKRMVSKNSSPLTAALYDVHELQQRQQPEPVPYLQPYDYELIPTTLIFDYLQQQQQQQKQQQQQRRPWLPYESSAIQFDNNYINDALFPSITAHGNGAEIGMENVEQDIMGFVGNTDKHAFKQQLKQSINEHSSIPNESHVTASFQKLNNNKNDDTNRFTLNNNHQLHPQKNNLNLDLNEANPVVSTPNANDYKNEMNDNDGDYQIQRYLYHLHKNQNHLTRK